MKEPSRNILLVVQYDGTDFAGWQYQTNARAVQNVVHEVLEGIVEHPVTLRASSRTDAGVHARALPVCFTTTSSIPILGIQRGLNARLPADVSITESREVPQRWRPRDASVAKTYRYQLLFGEARRPLLERYSWHARRTTPDVGAMRDAGKLMLGTHDFSGFRSSRCTSRSTIRQMHRVELVRDETDPLLSIMITGNAFLQNMVRIIAGTLVAVGAGRFPADRVTEVLESGDRTRAGMTAPPQGLTLWQVHFDGYPRVGKPGPSPPPLDPLDGGG